jgi:hypothetical protein
MKKLYNKTEIQDFSFYEKGIIFLIGDIRNRNVVFMIDDKDKILIKNAIIPSFKTFQNCIVLYSPQKSIVIDRDFQIVEYKGYIINDVLTNNRFLSDRIIDSDIRYLCLYNADNNYVIWTLKKITYFLLTYKDIAFCKQDNTGIIAIDVNTGMELWHFSIADFPPYINGFYREQEADIKQIIGVYNNLLWVHVGGFRLVGIDIETGKLVYQIEDIPSALGLTKEEGYHFSFNYLHLNQQEGVLKTFANRYYIEIDLNTLQGVVKKDFGENEKKSWRIRKSTYYQDCPDLLYFSGHYQNMNKPNAFGIFDTEKAEIVWYDTTKDDLGYFYNPPQANDKLLAVLDDKHNLLVYERDELK